LKKHISIGLGSYLVSHKRIPLTVAGESTQSGSFFTVGVGIIKKNNPRRFFVDYYFRSGLSQTRGFLVRELGSISHAIRFGYAF